MSTAIDMLKLIEGLPRRPRGRACIVLTHDYLNQRAWAAKLASQTNSDHLDLLEHAAGDQKLGNAISTLTPTELLPWLQKQSQSQVLVVSGIEVLTASWTSRNTATEQFASQVEMWSKSPAFLFVIQHNSLLANREFRRFRQFTFVVDQKDTLALT